jgi:hypothetical protein
MEQQQAGNWIMKLKRILAVTLAVATLVALAPVASATPIILTTTLSGPAEAPPNSSVGVGAATLIIDPEARTMRLITSFAGLGAPTTVTHIHCCVAVVGAGNAGVSTTTPTFLGFPANVTAGNYDQTFDMSLASSYNPAFVTANGGTTQSAQDVLFAGLLSGRAYLNIHTTAFPAGEIRGFFRVPEPATAALAMIALAGVFGVRRKRLA